MPLIRDSLLVFGRQARLAVRDPAWVIIGLIQPALYLAFLGPLLNKIIVPGQHPGGEWRIFVPGLLIQLGLFGAGFAGLSIIADVRTGVFERLRVTPVSRLALLFGRVLRDVMLLLVQAVVLLLASFAFGLRVTPVAVLVALSYVVVLAISLSSGSYALGLLLRREEALGPMLNAFMVPLMLLSGVILPMSLAPAWLNAVSSATPFRYIIDGMRAAFTGDWASNYVWVGFAVSFTLMALCVTLGARAFARESA
jgi:ABC-2 type transport system permease protein